MSYEWRVRPTTRPGTLVTISPAGPGMDVSCWNGEGHMRTKDPGPYMLLKIERQTTPGHVWRPARCVTLKGNVVYFSHFDLDIWGYGQ